MSILNFLSKIFSRTITLPDSKINELVCSYIPSGKYLKIGSMIEVPFDFSAVICSKHIICEEFKSGKHKIDLFKIPLTKKINRLSITRKSYFNGKLYYVSSKQFEDVFGGNTKVRLRLMEKEEVENYQDKIKVYGNIKFKINYKIVDAKRFLEEISIFDIKKDITTNYAKTIFGELVEVFSTRLLKQRKYTPKSFLENNLEKTQKLYDDIVDYCKSFGVEVINFKILETGIENSSLKNVIKLYPELEYLRKKDTTKINTVDNDDIANFNFVVHYKESSEELHMDKKSITQKENTLIDEEINNSEDDIKIKKCSHCNAILSYDSKTCYNCKTKFEDY